jgi:hypothetical protein
MRGYRIFLLDSQGHIYLSHEVECRDDLAALAEGEKLSSKSAVEVWEDGRLVARVKAQNMALNAEDRLSL